MKGKVLREKIYSVIMDKWPTHVSEVARILEMFPEEDPENKSTIAKVKYHFDQLAREHKINVKKIDRALVAWPVEVEKYRTLHEILGNI